VATTSTLSLDEYVRTTFHPDVEYLDGKLEDRNVGKYEHSRIQFLIALWFGRNERVWGVQGVTEQRMRVSPTRIRVPDIALLPPGRQPAIITVPPLLIVEVVSPDDRYPNLTSKAREFLAWGVPAVWIIDPGDDENEDTLVGEVWTAPDICTSAKVLTVAGTAIHLDLGELLSALRQS